MSKNDKLQIRNSTAEFLIFTNQAGEDSIEVRVADETIWLTQKLIGVLFEKGRSTITEHLSRIFESGELDQKAVCRDFRHTATDGKEYLTKYYNLDAIGFFMDQNGLSNADMVQFLGSPSKVSEVLNGKRSLSKTMNEAETRAELIDPALKYHAVRDAASELGSVADIREMFIGFQSDLYAEGAVA